MRTFVNAYGRLYRSARSSLVEVRYGDEWHLLDEKRSLLFLGALALASHLDLMMADDPMRQLYGTLTASQLDKVASILTNKEATDEEIERAFTVLHVFKAGANDTDVTGAELRARLERSDERLAA